MPQGKKTVFTTVCDAKGCNVTHEWIADEALITEEQETNWGETLSRTGWGEVSHRAHKPVGNTLLLCPACFRRAMAWINTTLYGLKPRE